jgi:hypothetical protein
VQEIDVFQIQPGWTAYDVRAEKIGFAIEVGRTYILVEKGPSISTDVYIPLSCVNSVRETESHFTVNVPIDEISSLGWQSPPPDGSWEASGATGSLAIPLREERSDAVRGYVDPDKARR